MKNPRNPYGGVKPKFDTQVRLTGDRWYWRRIGSQRTYWDVLPSNDYAMPTVVRLSVGQSVLVTMSSGRIEKITRVEDEEP